MKQTKDLLRKMFRQKRNSFVKQNQSMLNDTFYSNYAKYIADIVEQHNIGMEHGFQHRNINIGAFYPVNNEINCISIINNLRRAATGYNFSLPIVASDGNKVLTFREYTDESSLVPGAFKVPIPNENSPIVYPDALLVPMLSFSPDKYRLGYGGGYYDSTISALKEKKKNLLTIGIAFDIQQSEELPLEEHDMQLDYVLTQNKLFH